MKKINLLLIIAIAVITASSLTYILIQRSRIVQIEKYKMDVNITDNEKIGINVDNDAFHFGSLGVRGIVAREFKIHQTEEDVLVRIIKRGEMALWVSNPNNFIVRKGEEKTIEFTLSVPVGMPVGYYTGEIIVILEKV